MRFSIITICFNSEKTIERTIKSVLAQTYKDYEYIIVDGASKDDTMRIVKAYESKFSGKLKWMSEPDHGIYDAMNKGIKMANGDIVGIVNSDDWLEPDALDNVNNAAVNQSEPCVYTGDIRYHYLDGSTQIIKYDAEKLKKCSKVFLIGVNHPATFVPHVLYEKYGLFDANLRIQADGDLINRFYYNNIPFIFIKSVLSNQADGGASQTLLKQSLKDYKYILKKNKINKFSQERLYLLFYVRIILRKYSPTWIKRIHRR